MFLHKGKKYYPLEVVIIKNSLGQEIYNRLKRNKPYVYIAIETQEKEKTNG